jgi:hypothetical protein
MGADSPADQERAGRSRGAMGRRAVVVAVAVTMAVVFIGRASVDGRTARRAATHSGPMTGFSTRRSAPAARKLRGSGPPRAAATDDPDCMDGIDHASGGWCRSTTAGRSEYGGADEATAVWFRRTKRLEAGRFACRPPRAGRRSPTPSGPGPRDRSPSAPRAQAPACHAARARVGQTRVACGVAELF